MGGRQDELIKSQEKQIVKLNSKVTQLEKDIKQLHSSKMLRVLKLLGWRQ